jgi:RNA recognition motif-containing protein
MARIYVGNLPMDVRERELDDVFYKFGRITDLVIKRPSRPPAFGEQQRCRSWTPRLAFGLYSVRCVSLAIGM